MSVSAPLIMSRNGTPGKQCCIPIALDKFSPPLTLLSTPTCPPAVVILSSSIGSVGLWSNDISTATPIQQEVCMLRTYTMCHDRTIHL